MAKKKKNQDFQKVKIKAGRKIPKHLNETKLEFKTKKIQIKALSSNTTAGDFVKLLSNSSLSANLKLVYLEKLKSQTSTLTTSQGGEQIQAVCKYITDEDSRVRGAAFSCLKTCLDAVHHETNAESLSPLLSILLTFVNCGITHINEGIRKDAQKFFAYLLDKCGESLENHLMQMFLTKINTLWRKSLDADYYGLLYKFIAKYTANRVNRDSEARNDALENSVRCVKWVPINCNIGLHNPRHLAERFAHFQDFQLTFQSKSATNVYEQFMETIRTMAIRDAKSLIGKEATRTLTITDGQKALSAIRIILTLKFHSQLLQFWDDNVKSIPQIKIAQSTSTKISSKSESKTAAYLGNELNCCLNRFRKLLKEVY